MKKIIAIIVLLSTSVILGQKKIIFKSGEELEVLEGRMNNKNYVYTTKENQQKEVKVKKIKKIIDLSLNEEKFEFNQLGLTPYVVENVEGNTANQLYNKALSWVRTTFKKPEKVIVSQTEGIKIRLKLKNKKGLCLNRESVSYTDVKYVIDIHFKEGRYKFEPISAAYYVSPTQYAIGGFIDIFLDDSANSNYYRRNGFVKREFIDMPQSLEDLFNNLNVSLKEYMKLTKSKEVKESW